MERSHGEFCIEASHIALKKLPNMLCADSSNMPCFSCDRRVVPATAGEYCWLASPVRIGRLRAIWKSQLSTISVTDEIDLREMHNQAQQHRGIC